MSKVLFLENVAGVAGDMFTASFVDAGLVKHEELAELIQQLNLDGVTLEINSVTKATMRATHLRVNWQNETWKQVFGKEHHHHEHRHEHHHEHHEHHSHSHHHENTNLLLGTNEEHHWHTHYTDIDTLIEKSAIDIETKNLSRKIFRLIAEAEAEAHGIEVEKVAFHEVGTIDSILDVVMAAYCISKVDAPQIFATPIKTGRGFIKIQHGTHPVPPPASAKLLIGMHVSKTPEAITRENVELSTPTGIAIIKSLSPQFVDELPAGIVLNQGMGAGTMDLGSYPNVFRVTLLESESMKQSLPYQSDEVVEIVCNIDDDTPERIAWIAEQLLAKGALDVWQTHATGKKGRLTVCLSVLTDERSWSHIADWILRHSSTFGIRYRKWNRLKLVRKFEVRETSEGIVTHKIGLTTDGEILKEKREYDEIKKVWEKEL